KGTPPPKVWWVAPNALRTCLRILLRHLKVNVVLTTTDHHQEVISYLKKYNYHGLLADDPEYIIFDPHRYFSSVQLKLTFKGCLETKEYILNEVTRCLNLHPSRICVVAALLGNHILGDSDLSVFHRSLCPDAKGKVIPNNLIKAVVDYVRNLQSVDDLDDVALQVFGSHSDERCEKFKQSVLYYCKGNKNFGSHLPSVIGNLKCSDTDNQDATSNSSLKGGKIGKSPLLPTPGSVVGMKCKCIHHMRKTLQSGSCSHLRIHMHDFSHPVWLPSASSPLHDSECGKNSSLEDQYSNNLQMKDDDISCRSKFASETDENELSSLQSIRQVLGKAKHGAFYQLLANQEDSNCDITANFTRNFNLSGNTENVSNHQDSTFRVESLDNANIESGMDTLSLKQGEKAKKMLKSSDVSPLPKVSIEVMRISRERHQKGLMHPYIFQILSQGEIKIPVTFEDESGRELPSPSLLYRPLRQMIYALLFNHHHLQYLSELKKEKEGIDAKPPEILVKEWIFSKSNKYHKPEIVPSLPLGWPVPTITRLWFGSGPDNNKKRLQAFLTCMRSNSTLMCDPLVVPQHLILLCCVLRYLITSSEMPFLYKHELDAFLVQAVDPHLMDTEYTQKLEIPIVSPRGVMLAALFMQGVDHAIMANDACGAPISWLMCCPWLFFDGKIFHRKLLKANTAKNLLDLCDNRYDEVSAVEHMKSAIVEGLSVKFLTPSITAPTRPPHPFPNFPVPVQPLPQGRGRGHQRVVPRGGQLEVAGVVVGSWGPNYGQGPRSPSRNIPPQIVSVGGAGRGRGVLANPVVGRGITATRTVSPPGRPRVQSPPTGNRNPARLGVGRGAMLLHDTKTNSHSMGFEL
ncbi:constitutive coactivator of PPAR-gamma-like protein 1 homolog, partial [Parasteatoda tepidariorum]|uniref:constitutive coactivator of PPAR-gamma-like protein 1 homolog n=1 Tax=Parasteatoda tepidariorum TaxID=114398 RepID=UPI0039BC8CC6